MADWMAKFLRRLPESVYAILLMLHHMLHPRRESIHLRRYSDSWLVTNGNSGFFVSSPSVVLGTPFAFPVPWWKIKPGVRSVYESCLEVEQGEIVVDVGACFGSFALSVSDKAKKIITIEPEPRNISSLRNNLKNLENVIIIEKAVSKQKGKIRFRLSRARTSHSIRTPKDFEKEVAVQADTLDGILHELNERADYVKLNTEGTELEAVKGIKNFDSIRKIVVATHRKHDRESISQICEILKRKGFKVNISPENLVYGRRIQ